ncbi:nucleotide sugar dehydrogenase [Alkalibacillus haloalkaliphilus]|uniref:nucleotide sugar dehydrogenase n=1 Tax=Alkalibacillus haloalkaliphilus TaxID=94136 RepID=UPI002936045C|nr:nucleotide sugar dehydrogenase [Alkalibacillus haloalkaliphilus]MDV2582150.1 nucleotide sugar dehydrogenase [Alkalibacillus haloalkaliphilus]
MNKEKVAVIGLGYVGLPLAIELAKKYDVVGFDINESKINDYKKGNDVTGEVGEEALSQTSMSFTNDESLLSDCQFYIVSVPTPINTDKTPDLNPVIGASRTVGKQMGEDSIVVYESTVYPGTTEEVCVPILEEESGLKLNEGFKVGYSPERINPGDQKNTITNIVKIVSGSDDEALERVASLYESVIDAGVHQAESIKVAEAAKVIENAQRDINIAFMNELSMVFNRMNIPTKSVLEAAGTKWNFLRFTPGLVGGHCIGVDPYYFTYKAEQLGYHSQIVLAGRKINDAMGKHVASNTIKKMVQAKQDLSRAKVAILGLAFKENVQDVRNSKVVDIVKELHDYDINVLVHDPLVKYEEVESEYGLTMSREEELEDLDAIIVAVGHDEIKQRFTHDHLQSRYKDKNKKVLIDVKEIYDRNECEREGYYYWSL